MPNEHLPQATGPYQPGVVDVILGYGPKSLFFRLYYPTTLQKGEKKNWCPWLPSEAYLEGIAYVLMIYKIFLKFAFWWSNNIKIPASYGAKPKTDKPLKCIVFSHGLGGSRFLYSTMCCELASRGFMVAAIEHKDTSACYTYYYESQEDAEKDNPTPVVYTRIQLGGDHYLNRHDQLMAKSLECRAVLVFLYRCQAGTNEPNIMDFTPAHKDIEFNFGQLKGALDIENTSIMGHSFGAATALSTIMIEPHFKYGIMLDVWMFPLKYATIRTTKPLLFINTQTFHIAPNVESMKRAYNPEKDVMYTIKHTTHESQTDSVLLIGYWLNWFMKKIDPLTGLKINNYLIARFLGSDINDYHGFLEQERNNIYEGLTIPWA